MLAQRGEGDVYSMSVALS